MFDVANHCIFLALAGSQAHGTARAGSDVDLRGVCIQPLDHRLSLFRKFEQYEGELPAGLSPAVLSILLEHPTASQALAVKTECVIFDVAKFLELCASANPNALEILFTDKRDWLVSTPSWHEIYTRRHLFLTTKIQQTFLGYAMAQLKKIETHRSWLLHPPQTKPEREAFGLSSTHSELSAAQRDRIEQAIAEKLRSYGVDELEMPAATRIALRERIQTLQEEALGVRSEELEPRLHDIAGSALSLPGEVLAAIQAEKKYRQALKQWQAYESWKSQRNPARAALEAAFGYDTKHAMHLIRLMRMGAQALTSGELQVRRDDAAELLAIRDGAISYDALIEHATQLKEQLQKAAAKSSLPAAVDIYEVDKLATSLMY